MIKFLLGFPLLCFAASSSASHFDWKTDTLNWARNFWGPAASMALVKGGSALSDWCEEHFTESAELENPVGTTVQTGCSQIANLSHWGTFHHLVWHVVDAFPVGENSLAAYVWASVSLNDCHTSAPILQLLVFEGDKVASAKSYWDLDKLCGTSQPWNSGSNALDFIRGQYAQLDAAYNTAGAEMLTRLVGNTFISLDGKIRGPRAPEGIAASDFIRRIAKLGITKVNHGFVDAFPLATSPNTVAAYAMITQSFGGCTVVHPAIVIFTFSGGRVVMQEGYWDTNAVAPCLKKEL